MNWPVIVRPRAQADLEGAKQWYENRRAALGVELVLEVRAALAALREKPERYPVYYRGFRRVLLKRFPYKLFYRVEAERVIIFRILHTRQDHTQHMD